MRKINQKITTSVFVFFIIILLSISIILANNVITIKDYNINEEKIYYGIKYIDSKIIYMSNLLNNVENEINWKELQNQTNILYNYWNSLILDLNYLDINKEELTNFGKNLDDLTFSIKYHNINYTLSNLVKLYNKLTIYINEIDYNDYSNILSTRYNLLFAYSTAQTENWTLAHEYILKASDHIYNLVNSMDINQYSQYNINQAYVAVKEMENLINIKDLDVFYIKYKIALDKLENL